MTSIPGGVDERRKLVPKTLADLAPERHDAFVRPPRVLWAPTRIIADLDALAVYAPITEEQGLNMALDAR